MSRRIDATASSLRELTTADSLSPFWGRFKSIVTVFRAGFATPAGRYHVGLLAYVAALAAGGVVTTTVVIASGASVASPLAVLVLAAFAALAERSSLRITQSVEVSIALLPTLFAAVVFGPLACLIVFAASMLGDLRPPYLKWLTYTATRAITGATAGGVAAAMAGSDATFGTLAIATIAASLTLETLDVMFVSLTIRVRRVGEFRDGVRALGPMLACALPLQAPVVTFLAYAYENISVWTLPLFLAPALAAQRLFVLYQEQRQLAEDLLEANERLEGANLSFATALVATLDARDQYTAGHSAAVAVYARDIAARMGLSESEQELAHVGGLVHDIGKVGLPVGLLEKPGPLTLEERRQMEEHSLIGERILANVHDYADIARIVRYHHERVDGNGYPDGLQADEIPLLSRIIAVADAYNAMTSHRPYRDAMPSRVARLRLAQATDSQFDTSVVAAFEAILAGAPEHYRLGLAGGPVEDDTAKSDLVETLAATATASARFRTPSFS